MISRIPAFIAIVSIRIYQFCLSPLLAPCCRYYPTCSAYAIDAISHHGLRKGLLCAAKRVLRCHPFHPGGYDPVK